MDRHPLARTHPFVLPPAFAPFTLDSVRELLGAEPCWPSDLTFPVQSFGAADLMSDVLALSQSGMLLITGLLSTQVIRTAVVADLAGVVLVRGRMPAADIVQLARSERVPLLVTRLTMFEACGVLYARLAGAR